MTKKPEDIGSMSEIFGDIKPARSDRLHLQPQPPAALARFTRDDARKVLSESLDPENFPIETGEELSYRAPGLAESVYRKLRRGRIAVEEEIDLHGLSVPEAKTYLHEFIVAAQARGLRCVRVIHGKGKRSGQRGPVLKGKVDRWLRRWSEVLAFCSARHHDGGTGAVYVLLGKR